METDLELEVQLVDDGGEGLLEALSLLLKLGMEELAKQETQEQALAAA